MKIYTSAWELAVADVTRVRVDNSVLDQLLRGSAEVRWEIQSIQDQGITVEALDPRATGGTGPDLAALRQVLCEEADIVIRPVAPTPAQEAAFWSVAGKLADRRRLAQLVGCHPYEPQILIHSTTGEITGQGAIVLAGRIGAISPQRSVRLADETARLTGLHQADSE